MGNKKKTYTLEEIKESIERMRSWNTAGQGAMSSAVCRLSLPMSEALLTEVERLAMLRSMAQEDNDALMEAGKIVESERDEARAELESAESQITVLYDENNQLRNSQKKQ